MKLYHLDRCRTFEINAEIKLYPKESLLSDELAESFFECFNNGISKHCQNYFNNQSYYVDEIILINNKKMIDINSFIRSKSQSDMRCIELIFEMVRRLEFSSFPSRLTSLFAVEDLSDFDEWPELLKDSNYRIFEINVPDNTPRFDANNLRGGDIFSFDGSSAFIGRLPQIEYDFAYKYWSGQQTKNPRWEYLIKLPMVISGQEIRNILRDNKR